MEDLTIDILDRSGKMNPAYVKASSDIISQFLEELERLDNSSKLRFFKEKWVSTFDCHMLNEQDHTDCPKLVFKNKNKKMLFLLRYGN